MNFDAVIASKAKQFTLKALLQKAVTKLCLKAGLLRFARNDGSEINDGSDGSEIKDDSDSNDDINVNEIEQTVKCK